MRWALPLGLLLVLSLGQPCPAQAEPAEAQRAEARRLGYEGMAAYDAKRWAVAYERFRAADQLVHSPVFVLYMGRAKAALGDLLAAEELLRSLSEAGPADEPAWARARADARQELAEIERQIPRLVLKLSGRRPEGYLLELDGVAVQLGVELRLNPGAHTVKLEVGEQRVVERVELLAAEGVREFVLRLPAQSPPTPGPSKPGGSFDGGFTADQDSASGAPPWLSLGLIGLGVVSLGVSGGSWIVAGDKADQAKAGCVENRCPSSNAAAKDDALFFADVSTWTLIGGAAAVLGGGLLWLTAEDAAQPAAAARVGGPLGQAQRGGVGPVHSVRIGVGPQRFVLHGEF